MAAILVSGGTYSGSGDLTCDAVVLGGTNAADWGGTATFICPDGVLTLTDNSDVGYTDTAIFVRNGNSDTWTHNGGTVRFTGTGPQRVTDYYNAAWNWNNIEIQNNNTSLYEGVKWGSPWQSDTNVAGDLTLSGGAHYICDNKADKDFVVSGTVHLISGSFLRNAIPIDVGVGNAFGSLIIGANGTYAAASNGGEVLSITNKTSAHPPTFDHMALDNSDGGTFIHNNGTVSFDMQDSYQNIKMGGQWLYNLRSTNRESSYNIGLQQSDQNLKVANDFIIASGAYTDNSSYTVTVSGTVYCSGSWGTTINVAGTGTRQKNRKTLGSLKIGPVGTFTASNDTGDLPGINIDNRDGGGYGWNRNAAGTFIPNTGTVAFTMADNSVYVIEDEFYNLTIDLPHASYNELRYQDIDGNGLRVNNDFLINDGHFKFDTAADDMTVSGTLLVSGGSIFGITNTPTGDHNIGKLDIIGTYNATTGTTTVGASSIPAIFDNNGTFTHNDGTVTLEYGSGGDSQITGSARTTFHKLNTGFSYMHTGFVVEDTWATTGDGGGASNFYDASDNWVIGTTSSTGYLVTNVGTGIKAALNATVSGASEVYPAVVSGTKYDFHLRTNTLNNVNFTDAQTSDDDATMVLSNVDFQAGLTTNDGATNAITVVSGAYFAASGMNLGDSTTFSVTGALVKMYGNYMEDNAADIEGLDSATLWVDFADDAYYLSPNGSNLNPYYKNVFWAGVGRINQDSMFRSSNFVIGGDFYSQNRPIGTSGAPPSIAIANGGTIEGATGTFNASTFSNRGGLFVSSSALGLTGSTYPVTVENNNNLDMTPNATYEVWFKQADGASDGGVLINNQGNWQHNSVTINSSGYIYLYAFDYNDGGAQVFTWTSDTAYDDGKWHNLALVFDEGSNPDVLVYVDGKLIHSDNLGMVSLGSYASTRLGIGDLASGSSGGNNEFYGDIGRVSIWKSALSAAQIRTMMFMDFDTMDDSSDFTTSDCMTWFQFDEGEGTTLANKSTSGSAGVLNAPWATAGTWTTGNKLGSETGVVAGNIYIGAGVNPTIFGTSYFTLSKRKLVSGSKFVSKAHVGTADYYIATSGTGDYLNYTKLSGAPIGVASEVKILADGSDRSYFSFDSTANNEQCHTLVNAGYVRIVNNSDFYTQDFDNSQGIWVRDSTYGGTIHDDGSTPHEYEPIDLIDDIDSFFDTEELID